jgi:hypothetical protein
MPPYAADLAGLGPGFVRSANQLTCFGSDDSNVAYWAQSIGAVFSSGQILSSQFATASLQRGDLVQFYSSQHGYMHTAVATGDGDSVYSLWEYPEICTSRSTLTAMWAYAVSNDMLPAYVRTATPAWHRA